MHQFSRCGRELWVSTWIGQSELRSRRPTALETLESTLCLFKIGHPFLKFRAKNLGALIKPSILDCRRRGHGETFGKPQMLLSDTARGRLAQGQQLKRLSRRD